MVANAMNVSTNSSTGEIRTPDQRFHTDLGWLDSRHSFSFGHHHDPAQTGHGLLIVSNDDRVAPGGGFGTHPHRDMEIVTWVLSGSLEHRDSAGHEGVIVPGLAQRMSAGRGISHSEKNHSDSEPVHFVQMWVVPDEVGIAPGYEQLDVSPRLAAGGLVLVASGRGHEGAITIHQAGAAMWVGRLTAGEGVAVPEAPFVHVFVARGAVAHGEQPLAEGSALRLRAAGPVELVAIDDSEIIIWESDMEAKR